MNFLTILLVFFGISAHASVCRVQIAGLPDQNSFIYASRLLSDKGYVHSSSGSLVNFRYCQNCGYYGEGSMLELDFQGNHFQVESYSNMDLKEMIVRLISRIQLCTGGSIRP